MINYFINKNKMGTQLFDQYALLHFATGIVVYFWGVNIWVWLLIHTIFEWFENTQTGMHLINTYVSIWPGGKPTADTLTNSIGDTIAALLGWFLAYALDIYGSKRGWYFTHIKFN
jgi:hypothetical protein